MYEYWVVVCAACTGLITGTILGMKYMKAMQELDDDWRDWDDR